MRKNSLAFWLCNCTYIGTTSFIIPSLSRLPTKMAAERIAKDITPWKMIKWGSKKDMIDFLQTRNKLSNKIKRQINKIKQKASLGVISSKKALISNLNNSNTNKLPVSWPTIIEYKISGTRYKYSHNLFGCLLYNMFLKNSSSVYYMNKSY